MRDMNFFSGMSSEQKRAKNSLASVILILLIIVGILVAAFVGSNILFSRQERDLRARRDRLTSPEVSQQLAELEQMQAEIAQVKSSAGSLQTLERFLKLNPNIDTGMLDALVASMPDDLVIDTLSVNASQIAIGGWSLKERSPLVFSAALKENGYFEGVYLSVLARKNQTATDGTAEPTQPQVPDETEATEPTEPTEPVPTLPAVEADTVYTFSLTCQIQAKSSEEAGENQ